MTKNHTPAHARNAHPKKGAAVDVFLRAVAGGATISAAAQAAGISRRTAYQWRNRYSTFAAAWDDALETGTDRLEEEAVRRALGGSDTLLIFLLKARRPHIYRERMDMQHTLEKSLVITFTIGKPPSLLSRDEPIDEPE